MFDANLSSTTDALMKDRYKTTLQPLLAAEDRNFLDLTTRLGELLKEAN